MNAWWITRYCFPSGSALQEYSPGRKFVGDHLKLMKMAFLAAYELYGQRIKALNICFFRYTYGPCSTMVSDSWDDSRDHGLSSEGEVFAARLGNNPGLDF